MELGQVPARFDIIKLRLYFLKYILQQDPESTISKMYQLQIENPKRGDWASTAKKNLYDLKINLSNEEIRKMSRSTYNNLIRNKCRENAFKYLKNKRGKKGRDIRYRSLQMSEYLLPNKELSIEQQRNIFEIRNNMTNIRSNFCSEKENISKCICGKSENMAHIYYCKELNNREPDVKYENINGENIKELKYIQERFKENLIKKEKMKINYKIIEL